MDLRHGGFLQGGGLPGVRAVDPLGVTALTRERKSGDFCDVREQRPNSILGGGVRVEY